MEYLTRLFLLLWRSRPLRVAMMGAVGVVVQTIGFETLGIWLHLVRPSTAVLIGAEMGVVTSFFLNNHYSFSDRPHGSLLSRLLRFHLVVSGSLFIQWVSVYTTELWTSSWLILHAAYVTGILLGFISNYTGYRLWVWRHHDEPQN